MTVVIVGAVCFGVGLLTGIGTCLSSQYRQSKP